MLSRLSQLLDFTRRPHTAACLLLGLCALYAPANTGLNAESARPRTAAEFQRFFENRVPAKLHEYAVAGATVSVVQNGRIVYSGGFGCAHITGAAATESESRNESQNCEAVDPQRTLFRAGSISKLFAFTALMQLVEQGRVDLDADVNRYVERRDPQTQELLFRVPDAFDRPVTVRDLLRHTPGFEDRSINLFTNDPTRVQTLRETIETLPPERVRAPGEQIAYSNYGATMAGYIVERVSGESFESYVEKNIFDPLNMRNSTFRQPLPENFAGDMSGAYIYEGTPPSASPNADESANGAQAGEENPAPLDRSAFEAQFFEIVQGTPAGGISTTAEDMGRFLAAHLGAGRPILSPATGRRMHSTLFRPHPESNGFAHGWMEMDSHGQRFIGHGGDTIFFHSLAGILPESGIGFFISTNSATGMTPVWELREEFLNTFYPAPTGSELSAQFKEAPDADDAGKGHIDFDAYAGYYATNRRSEREMTKISSLFMTIDVHANKSGDGLLIRDFFTTELLDFVPVAKDVFQERAGHKRFFFLRDETGRIRSLLSNELAIMTFNRVAWYERPALHFGILGLGLILVLTGLIFRPTGLRMVLSKPYRASLDADARRAGWLGFAIVVSYLTFFGAMLFHMNSIEFIFTIPPRWPFYIPFAALLFQLAALTYVLPAWSRRYWTKAGRIIYTVLVLGLFPFFWFLYYWNLVA